MSPDQTRLHPTLLNPTRGRSSRDRNRAGFTLVELLVVIAIIGLLMGIALPAVMYTLNTSRRAHCLSNLRQIGLAMQVYVDRQGSRGVFPWAAVLPSKNPNQPSLVKVLGPFIEENQPVFRCPSDTKYYEKEKISYEYPMMELAGKTRPQLLVDSSGNVVRSSSDVWISYDLDPFHGEPKTKGSRNFVFLDGHTEAF